MSSGVQRPTSIPTSVRLLEFICSSVSCAYVFSLVVIACPSPLLSSVTCWLRSPIHEGWRRRADEALDDAFAEEALSRAFCWDCELKVRHLTLYLVRYIWPPLPPHDNKSFPHINQVHHQVIAWLSNFSLSLSLLTWFRNSNPKFILIFFSFPPTSAAPSIPISTDLPSHLFHRLSWGKDHPRSPNSGGGRTTAAGRKTSLSWTRLGCSSKGKKQSTRPTAAIDSRSANSGEGSVDR